MFEAQVRQAFERLLVEHGFVVESVSAGQRPEDGVVDAFGLQHYLRHQLGRSGPVNVSVPGDELASQAATVQRMVPEVVAFFAEQGYAERASAFERHTEAGRAARRRR